MKNNIKALMIDMLMPIMSICQVQFTKTSPSTINNILPFYSPSLASGSITVNFPFTRPPVNQGSGVPTNMNIDSTYDDLDDTTYEANPIFDLGRVINTSLLSQRGFHCTVIKLSTTCVKPR